MGNVKVEKISRPENIKLPYLLDFYPLEEEKQTRISRFFAKPVPVPLSRSCLNVFFYVVHSYP